MDSARDASALTDWCDIFARSQFRVSAFAPETLLLLQMLCEGHYTSLQARNHAMKSLTIGG
jgi:hypothetical protein